MARIKKISTINTLMTCIVVLFHCDIRLEPVSGYDKHIVDYIYYYAETVLTVAMSYFFFVSAFLLFRNLNKENYKEKIKRRCFSLLLPYFIWQFFFLSINLIILLVKNNWSLSKCVQFLFKSFRCIFLFYDYPPDGALWYLYAIFFVSLFSPIFLYIFRDKKWGFYIMLGVCLLVYGFLTIDYFYRISHYGFFYNVLFYSYSYMFGAFWGIHNRDIDDLRSLKYVAIALVFGYIISVGFFVDFKKNILCAVIPILLLCFFSPNIRIFNSFSKISFIMFAIHQPVFSLYKYVLIQFFSFISFPASIVNLLSRIIGLFVTIVLSLLIYNSLKKFAPTVLAYLTGGRM